MPRFSLEVTPAVKREEGWEVTAQVEVLYGNNPPDPPEEVVFDVNGVLFERTETNPESGIASSVMILRPGGYIVTAYRPRAGADDRNTRRMRSFAIREQKEKELTPDERETVSLKAKTKLVEAEKEFKEAQQNLNKIELPKPKSRLKILHVYKRPSRLEVILQRTKDGKPEDGEISVLDFEQAGIVFGDTPGDFPFRKKEWGIIVVFLPYFEYPRQVTFFLPDDPDAKTMVDVPARLVKEEKKPVSASRPSVFRRMREVYVQERNKAKLPAFLQEMKEPAFEFKIQRRQSLISLSDLPLREQD